MRKNKKNKQQDDKEKGKNRGEENDKALTICYLARCSNVPAIIKDVDDELYDCDL